MNTRDQEIRIIDTDDVGSNHSGNPHIQDMIEARMSRRTVLSGTTAVAATGFFGGSLLASSGAQAGGLSGGEYCAGPVLGFAEVPASSADTLVVPEGYTAQIFAPWGTPLLPGAPAFAEDASNSAADQALQVGFNHDGMHYFPLPLFGNHRGLLVVNHEYTDANIIYSAAQGGTITPDDAGKEKVAKALAGHGVSVMAVSKKFDGSWELVKKDPRNRRITGTTPMAFSGPVSASHPMLQSSITAKPLGTLNNCAHGVTPWGTYLACEENWNGYFGTDDTTWVASRTPLEARYGVSAAGFGYNWHKAEPRFDLAQNRNELNHFGWVVEIDPYNPKSQPVKRTALGRIKHEGATCTESKGRVVVYSGDDENGDYLYKFVGNAPWRKLRLQGKSPLDHGTLYVAKFHADGSGEWLPLVHGVGALTMENGWADQADVLIRTRMAADALGATRLHRPEWVAVHPHTKDVFVTLTNGSGNNAPVNSGRDPNPYGHIVRFHDADNSDTTFSWDIFLLAGDPAYDANVPATQPVFGSPDGIWVDDSGLVWIQTDISNSSQNLASRGYDNIGNNAMLAANPDTGEVRRFLTGPRGCEITGVSMTPDQRTMFVNVQHPGESTTFWNNQFGAPTTANPSSVSSWPFGGRPRPATVVIRKLDGGKIGS
ncbi:MAG: PhoX family phosphatase [Gammaproteobacteria bacterium]|nr:PhoX family phosphatase [Gammaproteobacteria bacterium]